MAEANLPSNEEVESYIRDRNNWGRWGDDDQRGVANLITPEKVAAASLGRRLLWPALPWTVHHPPGLPCPLLE